MINTLGNPSADYPSGKKIMFVTGTRADFGKLEPLASIAASNNFSVLFFVTGMHMLQRYGLTKEEVQSRFEFETIEFLNQREGDPQDVILAKTVSGFSDVVKEYRPDLVVVHGDRVEALACSLVCAMNYIKCAHVEGGEVSGTIDEIFRHCNTKLASSHFVSSNSAAKRVMRLGEDPHTVYTIGSPELDIHSVESNISIDQVKERYAINFDDYGVCIFHPVTSELESIGDQARILFDALIRTKKQYVVIMPNNDPGTDKILKVERGLPQSHFRLLPSMRFEYFSVLLKTCSVIVGNTSVGVREAPFLGKPSVNIGTRQKNRAKSDSIRHCDAFNGERIQALVQELWGKKLKPDLEFGVGNGAEKFLGVLKGKDFWSRSDQKFFFD